MNLFLITNNLSMGSGIITHGLPSPLFHNVFFFPFKFEKSWVWMRFSFSCWSCSTRCVIPWWCLGARDWTASLHATELPLLLGGWANSMSALVNWGLGSLLVPDCHGCFPASILCAVGLLLPFPLSALPVPVGCAAQCHAQGTSHGLCGRALNTCEPWMSI